MLPSTTRPSARRWSPISADSLARSAPWKGRSGTANWSRPSLPVSGTGKVVGRLRITTCLCVFVLGFGACAPERGGPMHDVQHISVYIARPPAEVYEFASDPRNLPRWAAGLARSEVKSDGKEWIADAPFGKVRVRFAQRNSFGV